MSDVYQDLFHEGSYVGKGIYDVDAFERRSPDRVPENTLLSHDLFEGFYARAGAVHRHRARRRLPGALPDLRRAAAPLGARRLADRALAVAHGARRAAARRPQHAAGDRALEDPRQPAAQPARRRRSSRCSSPAWTVLPGSPLLWTDARRFWCSRFPAYVQVGRSLTSRVRGVPLREHSAPSATTSSTSAAAGAAVDGRSWRIRAAVMLDAIGRTLVRLLVTRRHLLEWVTADRAAASRRSAGGVFARRCGRRRCSPCVRRVAIVAVIAPARLLLARADPGAVVPLAADRLRHRAAARDRQRRRSTRDRARGAAPHARAGPGGSSKSSSAPDDHWLVPDNYQENRARLDRPPHVADQHRPAAAGRRSAAYDFGYLSIAGVARPARADLRHAAAHAALSRPFLQLVRHADARAAAAGLHLDGRQRQPRRLSPDAAARA